MEFHWSDDTTSSIYKDSLAIRKTVFIDEQHVCASIEIDELEDKCSYVVGYCKHIPVATARLFLKDQQIGKIQRVAVLKDYRGMKIGQALLEEIARHAKCIGLTTLTLGAQNHAISFYEKLGYTIIGEEYEEANILHRDMIKNISNKRD